MKVLFGESDKMFRLIGEALSPSPGGPEFLAQFFLTESDRPADMLAAWSARRQIPDGIEIVHCERPEDFNALLNDAIVLVVENTPVNAASLSEAKSLKLIQTFGRTTSNVDLDACARRNIEVSPLDRHSNRLVTEHVVMLMLALARGAEETRAAIREPSSLAPSGWAFNWPACKSVRGLSGAVVGLIGLGQVGAMVAEYLRPFGVTVIYNKRSRDYEAEQNLGIAYESLENLVARSDVISLHVPGNEQTRNLVDARLLDRMKPGVLIVNTARGSVIDEDALVAALRSGRVGGAGLDVFSSEPLRTDHPFFSLQNVILTPHVAAGTRDERWLDREIGPVVDNIVRTLKQ